MQFREWRAAKRPRHSAAAYNVPHEDCSMKEWGFAQTHPSEELAEVHFFSVQKHHASGQVEFTITVKEYITPKEPTMHFFAQADKEINQGTAPTRPVGRGNT